MNKKIARSLIGIITCTFLISTPITAMAAPVVGENGEGMLMNIDNIPYEGELMSDIIYEEPDISIVVYTFSELKPDYILEDETQVFLDPFGIEENDMIYFTTEIRKKTSGYVYYMNVYSLQN